MNEQSIFMEAMEREGDERRAFLDEACAGDLQLRQRVEKLLVAHDQGLEFMNQPAGRLAPTSDHSPLERPGAQIGPYKLREQIGEGGFGVVYVAEQEKPVRRKVALKIIKPGMDTKDVIARFEAERQALALMDHPNVARVLDAGSTESGRPYFVMELVHGVPITEFCDKNKLSTRERLLLFADICRAVQHAHQKGIIHRDLKPSNIMVTLHDGKPVAKVIDFGVSKALSQQLTEKSIYTAYGQMIGTPTYMSPEQAEMSGLGIDTRSDIYSLGVLLYELLTGATPLDAKRLRSSAYAEILRIIREEEAQRPSLKISTLGDAATTIAQHRHTDPQHLRRELRGELDWIVMKCLDKDRARRYETANALARDIERHLRDEPVEACPPSVGYRVRKFTRRHKRALATATILAVALLVAFGAVAGTIGWTVRDHGARRTKLAAQLELILEEVKQHEAEQKWPDALAAARRAEALLVGGGGDVALEGQVRQVLEDLNLVQRLEQIRLQRSDQEDPLGWTHEAFAAAFREAGVDLDKMNADDAARRLASREAVAPALAVSLDEWATWRMLALEIDGARAIWAVADRLDTNPWRRQMRALFAEVEASQIHKARNGLPDTAAIKALADLAKLAASPELLRQPPVTLHNFGMAISQGARNPELGAAILRKAHLQYPSDFWINVGLGWSLAQLEPKHSEEALGYYRAALALRPEVASNWICIAQVHQFHQKKFDEANACYQKALALEPDSAWVHYLVALGFHRQNKLDEAVVHYRKAIELNPEIAMAYVNLGNILRGEKKLDEAAAVFRKAIKVDPRQASSHHGLGLALLDQHLAARDDKILEQAVTALRTAAELGPNTFSFWSDLTRALQQQKKPPEVIEVLRKSIELNPRFAAGHVNLGNLLRAQKMRDEAIASYRRAIELDPKSAASYYGLGVLRLENSADESTVNEAIAHFRKGIEGDPTNVQCHWGLARAHAKLKQFDEAIASFHKCLELNPNHGDSHWGLGYVLLDQKKPAEAVIAFQKSIAVNPKHAFAFYGLGLALIEQQQPQEASAAFRKSTELDPKYVNAHYRLGALLREQNKLDDALASFRTVLDLDPTHAKAREQLDSILRIERKTDAPQPTPSNLEK